LLCVACYRHYIRYLTKECSQLPRQHANRHGRAQISSSGADASQAIEAGARQAHGASRHGSRLQEDVEQDDGTGVVEEGLPLQQRRHVFRPAACKRLIFGGNLDASID